NSTIDKRNVILFTILVLLIVPIYWIFLRGYFDFPKGLNLYFIEVQFYSLVILGGISIVSYLFDKEKSKYKELRSIDTTTALMWILIGALVGARLWHVVTDYQLYTENPIEILHLWNGGLGIFGGIIGGFVGAYYYRKSIKTNFLKALSLLAVYLPLGQVIGRFGNFSNKELYGRETNLPWGFYIEEFGKSFYPTFAYEQIGNLIVFIFIYFWYKKFGLSKDLIIIYLAGYATVRFLVDFSRLEDRV
ncbi:MAG TPA: prolipoprotein diacylglyceryl transferase, partial [Candidatus Dojkabacteria bacterium]|nr:prolipoprotein diacylglyceryl transferase [Candidatus Dojkabacteria bacterium]